MKAAMILALLMFAGCATAVLVPTQDDVAAASAVFPDVTLHDLSDGRALFVARCAGCHQLPVPSAHRPDEWPGLVGKMEKISDGDKALIERYLVAASARSRPSTELAASR